jgi:hypothetical protein
VKTRTTLRDIAKEANVHFTTVGLAVRGDTRVDKETAARILTIAKRMDYRPDPLLSALSTYRNRGRRVFHGNIGYVFTTAMNEVNTGFRTAYRTAREHADRLGFCMESFELSSHANGPNQLQRILVARGIQGVILSPLPSAGVYPDFQWSRFAVATIGQSITSPMFHRACNHQAHSMRQQLVHLRELGYRRVGLVLSEDATFRTEHSFLGAYVAEQFFLRVSDRLRPLVSAALNATSSVPHPARPKSRRKPGKPLQTLRASAKSAKPAVTSGEARAQLATWLTQAKPDCVIASEPVVYDLLKMLGRSVPRDLGFSLVARRDDYPKLAGPEENWEMLGEAAVDIVISLLGKRVYGVPETPLTTLVGNKTWQTGETLRSSR